MKKKWLYFFVALAIAPVLTGCDRNSSDNPVVHSDGGNGSDNNGNGGGDNGNGGGDNGNGGGDGTTSRCSGAPYSNALNALNNRNASLASEDELIDYSKCVLDIDPKMIQDSIAVIYDGLGKTFSWDPGKDSQVFEPVSFDTNFSLLQATYSPDDKANPANNYSLAVAGDKDGHRYVALSANPVINDNADLQHWMTNIVTWLTDTKNSRRETNELAGKADNKLHVIIAQVNDSSHYNAVKRWLDKKYPDAYTLNDMNTCDFNNLKGCLTSQPADLVIIFGTYDPKNNFQRIRDGMNIIINNKIPFITMNSYDQPQNLISGIYAYMGISATKNYYTQYQSINYPLSNLKKIVYPLRKVINDLLTNLKSKTFDTSVFNKDGDTECKASVLSCYLPAFHTKFRQAADFYRDNLIALDRANINIMATPNRYPLLTAGLLMADKYRQQIDYPVVLNNEPAEFQRAMFADWVVSYSRTDNMVQPDLGEYATKASDVVKGNLANYTPDKGKTDTKTVSIPYPKQWTATGWYLPAGKAVTFSSTNTSASVEIQLGYGFSDVYQSAATKMLVAPSDVSLRGVGRIPLSPGESITISSPYGAPVYINFTDDTLTSATITSTGVAPYAALLNFTDNASIAAFEQEITRNIYPHVVVASTGMELHMTNFNFKGSLTQETDVTTTHQLLGAIKDYYTRNYTLGGFKLQDIPLSQSLPADDLAICSSLFGQSDCTDEKLHTRTIIQHAIFDQRSRCAGYAACSGNPFDAGGPFNPYGWGENHELGHNLQINQLNVQYVEESRKEDWTGYSSRAGENSNNIFPYMNSWKRADVAHKGAQKNDHGIPTEVYAVAMSELRGLKDSEGNPVIYDSQCNAYSVEGVTANRYTAAWQNNAYAVNNGFREAFYFQMLLQADKQIMRSGDKLENGFNIFTLLYQHARIYGKYAANEADWNSHKSQLGFDLFNYSGDATYGGTSVSSIPGNDFMLVSLSYITNADWRPYFDMFGLHYTSLASQQVDKNGFNRTIKQEILVNKNNPEYIPNESLSADPDIVSVDLTDPKAKLPGASWDCPK